MWQGGGGPARHAGPPLTGATDRDQQTAVRS
ncbi:hypothetical protein G3I20_03820 [Streptomyces sp. SID8111]|uniref:Uncharacterized protein n=2 Tax=unclassified Streptomyces TaxID=2593676 RepID=A0A6G3QXP1_9ACTN|nr:hypothetical protein [Streptomyces sp. SID14436]NEC25723.1 hypothetical protein [Streptomyces sp. SID8111]NEC82297.1 hypothetical protein [Streptomyces sp. SID7958]